MKPSELLREAKKNLWDGNGDWVRPSMVCTALLDAIRSIQHEHGSASQTYKSALKSYKILMDYITAALNGHATVLEWLHNKAGANLNKCTMRDFQIYRHRWINHMIREFKRSGQ